MAHKFSVFVIQNVIIVNKLDKSTGLPDVRFLKWSSGRINRLLASTEVYEGYGEVSLSS